MAYPNFYQGGYYPQYQNGAVPDMLNQYKGQYQQQMPMVQQPIQQMPMQNIPQPIPSNDMIWVLSDNAPKTPVEHKCACGDKFVLKSDFQALQSEFDALRSEWEELKAKPKAKTTKKAVEEAENDGE